MNHFTGKAKHILRWICSIRILILLRVPLQIDVCMYVHMHVYVYVYTQTQTKLLFDCGQFITGSLKNIPSVLYLCTRFGQEGGTESPLRFFGFWELKPPWCKSQSWGTGWNPGRHPSAVSAATAGFSAQSDGHLPPWAEAGDTALPKPSGRGRTELAWLGWTAWVHQYQPEENHMKEAVLGSLLCPVHCT